MSPEHAGSALLRAMGVELVVAGATRAELAAVATLFGEWERVFSRFRADSELSRVNALDAEAFVVSPLFARRPRTALAAAAATDGLVDPTLGAALEAAGYDRDFARAPRTIRPAPEAPSGSWRSVRHAGRRRRSPAGTALDLNGVVKALPSTRPSPCSRDRVRLGRRRPRHPRRDDVALPEGGAVRLAAAGSRPAGRRAGGGSAAARPQHHLIDPRTGRPVRVAVDEVTVAAGSALAADVAAKAAFLLGTTARTGSTRAAFPAASWPRTRSSRTAPGTSRSSGSPPGRGGVVVVGNAAWYVARAGGMTAFLCSPPPWSSGFCSRRERASAGRASPCRTSIGSPACLPGRSSACTASPSGWTTTSTSRSASLLVPGTSPYRPLAVAAGVVAAELLVALALTNRYRQRLSYRFWRRAHYLNFAVWALALVHGVTAGTDSDTAWAFLVYAAAVAAVAGLTAWRALHLRRAPVWALALWSGVAAVLGVELMVAVAGRPLGL